MKTDRPFVLDRTGAAILHLLAQVPVALRQTELAGMLDISRRTLYPSIERLQSASLIDMPHGERSGYAITSSGRNLMSRLPERLVIVWRLAR